MSVVETTCPYCGVGCGVLATHDGRASGQRPLGSASPVQLIAVQGSPDHPANQGRLCVKGTHLPDSLAEADRLLYPELDGRRCDWDEALSATAARLGSIIAQHGPQAVAIYGSGQLLTEDYYVANKLMKGALASANIDTNSRLCMASAVASYKRAFGADVVPCSYRDLETCQLLIMVGSNAAWAHPVLYQRISLARKRNGMKVVLIDPRKTASAAIADLHLSLRPGTDAALFNALLAELAVAGELDESFIVRNTEGFEQALAAAAHWTPERSADFCDLPLDSLRKFFDWVKDCPRTVTLYSQGINQSQTGTDQGNAILNFHLASGRIGQEGMGPFSITGQPNAMGGREVGGLANQLAAHLHLDRPQDRATLAAFWGVPRVADKPGYQAVDLFQAIADGKVRAVWIMATNPVVSLPDTHAVRRALQKAELVIVSDCQRATDTMDLAHIRLPAAAWGEKSGTVTNSERCISRQRAWRPAPGAAKPDWWIITQVARRLGFAKLFPYASEWEIFIEHAALSGYRNAGTRAFDISGYADLSRQAYDNLPPRQWPINRSHPEGTERLFEDGRFFTDTRRARFWPIELAMASARTCPDYPWLLNTGRARDQWHTMTRTGHSARLAEHSPEPTLALHPEDALLAGWPSGTLLVVRSVRGRCVLRLQLDPGLRRGECFAPIHWTRQWSQQACVGDLIAAVTDPISGQPALKQTPVHIKALQAGIDGDLWTAQRIPLDAGRLLYWSLSPEREGWRYRFRHQGPLSADDWPRQQLDAMPELLRVVHQGVCDGDAAQKLDMPRPSADPGAEDCAWRWFRDGRLFASLQHSGDMAAMERTPRILCVCRQVSTQQIDDAIAEGLHSTFALGRRLGCGTGCGSCLAEIECRLEQSRVQPVSVPPSHPF